MMSATIRRKALSLCSSALANNAFGRGSKLIPEFHQGAPVYSKSMRDVASSLKADFPTQKWIRSFSSYSEPAVRGDINEPIAQIQTNKGIAAPVIQDAVKMNIAEIQKTFNSSTKKAHNRPAYFTVSGAAIGSTLSTPIVNAPQAAKLGMGSTVSSTFLPNLALFWHINNGIEEILADYVHHEMTRSLVLVLMRLFLIVAAKDVFVATN
ncbi:2-oxoacid dehydrogenase acyltransferase, catalytic domain-containing protein [Cynara cardunculus var. scolymus]|uniref:2-oxoacid dehydrogenase acyltransferase, catalytic domain-containing protein n=1 Tax=Cynara cardunculus var. scolymus TaxID=59895 RepID=A0A103XB44_CYNCS|nr:2-oxoacid dehydrogenase acyltransferase, catalytic domain-containing protein [Cynara cardunculus var. scolymus]